MYGISAIIRSFSLRLQRVSSTEVGFSQKCGTVTRLYGTEPNLFQFTYASSPEVKWGCQSGKP
ncbi:hypothetical protein [Clostridium kluyveri]|uniref:Uncharacterized protein n=1 Tax=Clostridium kluyveri (strain ATCC 8527 / DSM 555 / NBRC 12016 / NCIMB 10680 / K1) TaxID=431943 RepID=A5N195_CLOK5|nr:hypothetical protein [Clostridium kluyveri]EDK34891.1 Hypothetical protein CKL_2879 [Clostridium kluyveri DSM 555]